MAVGLYKELSCDES